MKDLDQYNTVPTGRSSGKSLLKEDKEAPPSGSNIWNPLKRKRGLRRYIGPKRIIIGCLFFTLVGVVWYLRHQGYVDLELVFAFIGEHPLTAPLIFIVCYALAIMLMIPSLPLNLGAGFLWGPLWGMLIATSGTCLGAMGAFALARTLMGQPLAQHFDSRIVKWLQVQLKTKDWKIVAFTRINPVIPSGPLNFAFGLTSINLFTYLWSSFVFLIPPTFAFTIIGYEVGGFVVNGNAADFIRIIFIVSGIITLMGLIKFCARFLVDEKDKVFE